MVYAVGHAAASVAGGAAMLAGKGHPTLLGDGDVWRSLGIGMLAFVVWTMLGFGFGMLVRNQVAAVLIAVGASLIGQIALNIIFAITDWTCGGALASRQPHRRHADHGRPHGRGQPTRRRSRTSSTGGCRP